MRISAPVGLLLSLLAIIATPASAQTETDSRLWLGFALQGEFGSESPWTWTADGLVRARDFASTLDAVGQRVIVSRRLGSLTTVGGGYMLGKVYRSGGNSLIEQRILQQLTWGRPAGRTSVSARLRVEQRLVETNDRVAVRVRGQVRLTVPLPISQRTSLVVSDEIFVHANGTDLLDRGFDSHRIYAGLRQPVGRQAAVDLGYYNVYSHGRSGVNRRSHVLSLLAGLSF